MDEFTGRMMTGRRWSDGLHQAVEAKEAVKIQNENQTFRETSKFETNTVKLAQTPDITHFKYI